ncbi:hypothetical protein RB195_012327 [Necator americanus]|uniref:Uncharacterized protein n=1 Tax=Necator americanus TaxID=51031 RepID=A0ABR1D8F2_NECAM
MLGNILFLTAAKIGLACSPSPSGYLATVTFISDLRYIPEHNKLYKDHVSNLIKSALVEYGVDYNSKIPTFNVRSINDKVAVDVHIPTADCITLYAFGRKMKKSSAMVKRASAYCGTNPIQYL